mmetsp:Transcript_5531/g.13425  ORF Transcript_5531/g.13425 Transcript_5531/m.13425 type:complete len:664 (+) Transcript_5531:234-2225(+)
MAAARRPDRLGEGRWRVGWVGARFLLGMCCVAVMVREGLVDAQPNPLRRCCPEGEGHSVVPSDGIGRTCCRATDCSLCSGISTSPKQGGQDIPTELHLHLEAVPVGSFCPEGEASAHVCTQTCGQAVSTVDHAFTFHRLVTATAATSNSTCAACCVLNFDIAPLACQDKCNHATGGKCFACDAASHPSMRGAPCGSYLDSASCAHVNGTRGYCVAHACAVQTVDVRLAFIRDFRLTIDAPKGFQYTFMPTASGLLIMHYSLRIEPHRETCCPAGVVACCGGVFTPGAACNGPASCADGGECRAYCGCPFDKANTNTGPIPPTNLVGDTECYTAAGQTANDVCSTFEVIFPLGEESFSLIGASPSFGMSALHTLKWHQAKDSSIRPSAPALAQVRMYGGGIIVDLEIAMPVVAGEGYALQGVAINVFSPETSRASSMCPGISSLPLKPTSLTMRSYVIGTTFAGPVAAGGQVRMATEASCSGITSCGACVVFTGTGGARCDWRPQLGDCYARGGSATGVQAATSCSTLGPPKVVGTEEGAMPPGARTALIIVTVICGVVAMAMFTWLSGRAPDYNISLKAMAPAATRETFVEEVRAGRGRSAKLVPRNEMQPSRHPDGTLDHQEVVMRARAEDPATPWHLMAPAAVARHARRFMYQRYGESVAE